MQVYRKDKLGQMALNKPLCPSLFYKLNKIIHLIL